MAAVGAVWILLWLFVALVGAPLRPDPSPMANDQHLDRGMLAPGSEWHDDAGATHVAWLGTDRYGRDLLSRLMAGSGISLSVGAGAVLISLLLGLMLGGLAGYLGGRVDAVISWFLQVMWSVPTLLMVLAITLAFGKGFWQVFLAIGLTMWVEVARIVRGQFLSLREQAYVQAAEALDLPAWRIMLRHMLPNAVGPLVVVCAANFAGAILIEAGLSFLGVGAQIPMPSWGNIVKEHAHLLTTDHAWLALIPGALIASLVLAFTWVGDGLRHAMNDAG
jgi:peptide/nickel transport system permease protein